jgi:glycine/D-amino acid oxidase-like deaminating enzyme
MRIAIIGTGISGLTAAYFLSEDHEVVVFESNDYVGGHTNTVDAPSTGNNMRWIRALSFSMKKPIPTPLFGCGNITYAIVKADLRRDISVMCRCCLPNPCTGGMICNLLLDSA